MSNSFFARQLAAYPRAHQDRANLLLHAFAVPVFIAGFWTLPAALLLGHWVLAVAAAGLAGLSNGVQGRGHGREAERPRFGGPGDFVARLLTEQLVTFPRFVLGGGFARAWRRPKDPATLGLREPKA